MTRRTDQAAETTAGGTMATPVTSAGKKARPGLFAFTDAECEALAREHGTPLFAYRGEAVRMQLAALREALPPRVTLAYAVKANPHPGLLRAVAEAGASFDCASRGELERVWALGVPGSRIYLTGPAKQRHELALARELGARVQAESWEDLVTLEELATGPVQVNLRVHPSGGIAEDNRIIGGVGPSAFGVDEEDVPGLLDRAARLRHVQVAGLHVFAASNERRAETLLATYEVVMQLARHLADLGVPVEQIDVGGGLGIPYAAGESPLDVAAWGAGIADLLARHSWFTGQLMVEPGRFVAGPCGVYLARVVRVKESRGTRFVLLQAGANHLLRPLLTGQPFPARLVGAPDDAPGRPATLAGPLCTSLDRLGDVDLPETAPGDLVVLGQAGAYGATEAMTRFLCHPEAAEVWVD